MKITIFYELSDTAKRHEFVENAVYCPTDNIGVWREVDADLSDLSKEDREFIWDYCMDDGGRRFFFRMAKIDKVCDSVEELIAEITK